MNFLVKIIFLFFTILISIFCKQSRKQNYLVAALGTEISNNVINLLSNAVWIMDALFITFGQNQKDLCQRNYNNAVMSGQLQG